MKTEFSYEKDLRIASGNVERVMGTRFGMIVTDIEERAARSLWDAACAYLEESDTLLDRFNPESEVARFNAGLVKEPSARLRAWMDLGDSYAERTDGLFSVRYGGGLDFGGLAKGAALSFIADLFRRRGVHDAFVDFGGSSIFGAGHHPYGPSWTVGVTDPYTGAQLTEISLRDEAMSTSGNTPRYGGHIVDPRTGERVLSRRLVTVKAPDATDAEVLSTAAMVADEKERKELEKRFSSAEILIFEV